MTRLSITKGLGRQGRKVLSGAINEPRATVERKDS
jgi:hypothetical protein